MITKEQVALINGGLFFLSASMSKYRSVNFVFTADLRKLDKEDLIGSYASLIETQKKKYGKFPGDEMEYPYLTKVKYRRLFKYIKNAFNGRIGNEEYIIWKVTDEINILFEGNQPEDIYVCDVKRRLCNQQGNIFFIPAGKKFLVLKWVCTPGLYD